jgi:hypothetical protein
MKKNVNINTVSICCILFISLCLLIGATGCNQPGRYQFVGRDLGNPYVIDTVTGKYWTMGDRGPRSNKPEYILPGKIGRYKGVYNKSDLYMIDTATGKVWTP